MQLGFQQVCLRALGTVLPDQEISSAEIEKRLSPAYERLRLVPGRLELMTGIKTRRHFPRGTLPSEISVRAAEDLFSRAPEWRNKIDCLIHASVCRNFSEPATATVVHDQLRLSRSCLVFDLSNACLSWINAWVVAAGLIHSGQVNTALIVCGEDAGSVVEKTIENLNLNLDLSRKSIKPSIASLTLGSGGAAAILSRGEEGASLLGGAFRAASEFNHLCTGSVTMETDSETMLHQGIFLAQATWSETRAALGWTSQTPQVFITHQVGDKHRQMMLQGLELEAAKDFSTFESLGNMGSASIGVTLHRAAREGRLAEGDSLALLGIGSGLVCGMLGVRWSETVKL